jgi:predicted nucleic-acid-binding protein
MRLTADTNVLVRAAVGDDPAQAATARRVLRSAEVVAVTLPVLCEFVWVLARGYHFEASEIAAAIRRLIESTTVAVDRDAVESGLQFLETGGDFADGVIAYEGAQLGGDVFVSFDREAVALARAVGIPAALPGASAS